MKAQIFSLLKFAVKSRFFRALRHLPLFLLLWSLLSCFATPYARHLREAEEHTRAEEFELAIKSYERHIAARLEVDPRPTWENPYFYHLIIGDLYLQDGKVDQALASYRLALDKKVDQGLVSDRFRLVANWYAEHSRYEEALDLIERYRFLDELVFDLMADRIAREMAQRQDISR